MHLIQSLQLDSFLSFPPGSDAVPLGPLNVLIVALKGSLRRAMPALDRAKKADRWSAACQVLAT